MPLKRKQLAIKNYKCQAANKLSPNLQINIVTKHYTIHKLVSLLVFLDPDIMHTISNCALVRKLRLLYTLQFHIVFLE